MAAPSGVQRRPGVTAAFNRNLLERLDRELGADFRVDQQVRVANWLVHFRLGESIWTESSYKFTPEAFSALATAAGWSVQRAERPRASARALASSRLPIGRARRGELEQVVGLV